MHRSSGRTGGNKNRQRDDHIFISPISYQTVYRKQPEASELNELISGFARRRTFFLLANVNALISFYLDESQKADYVQRFLIWNLVDSETQILINQAMENYPALSEGPVFHRQQLLMLMKLLLLNGTDDGPDDPNDDLKARHKLGRACLILNDFLITPDQEEQLKNLSGERERDRIHDELYSQFIYTSELRNIPDPYHATVRNSEYIKIFDRYRARFQFTENLNVSQRFHQLTNLDLERYLWLLFGVFRLYDHLSENPQTFIDAPKHHNISKDTVFSKMNLTDDEVSTFFQLTATDFDDLVREVQQSVEKQTDVSLKQDFTAFRKPPLIYTRTEKDVAVCLDFGFLIEKISLGLYHLVLTALEGQEPDRTKFLRNYWGDVFEIYVNDRLRDAFPIKTKRLFCSPKFDIRKKDSQAFDAALVVSDSLIVMEHKGKYLTLEAKYTGNRELLKSQLDDKFGLGTRQLARSLEHVFNSDRTKRITFSERDKNSQVINQFSPERLRKIRRVYPILVLQDFSLQLGFANWNLREIFNEELQKCEIDRSIIRPLTVMTIEDLEAILPYLKEVPLPNILDCYARELEPIKTFKQIFKGYIQRRRVKTRVNEWVEKRLREIVESMKSMFRTVD